jgi:hypothetical protein
MALRIRRSITVGAGVRTGAQNAAYTVNPIGPRQAAGRRRGASASPPPTWSIPAKPGMLAPPLEREFFMGLEELRRGEPQLALERFESAARRDRGDRALSDDLLAGLTAVHVGDPARAIPHLSPPSATGSPTTTISPSRSSSSGRPPSCAAATTRMRSRPTTRPWRRPSARRDS